MSSDIPTAIAAKNPLEPERVDITALHLIITQTWASGSSHNVHLVETGDLGVILNKGQAGESPQVPTNAEGHVVVVLGVDDDHDEVHYGVRGSDFDAEEALARAIETLQACRSSLSRIRRA